MTSFKWNVHNHGRTANLKWCSEIVHSNPAWLHPDTAAKFGLKDGDFVELKGYRSKHIDNMAPKLGLGQGEVDGVLRLPVYVTKAVHPKAIAISNSLGHFAYTSVALGKKTRDISGEQAGYDNQAMRDADLERRSESSRCDASSCAWIEGGARSPPPLLRFVISMPAPGM